MKVYEYGIGNERTFAMFQCAAEPWWVFEASAREMARDYHVCLFIADGHDELGTTFTSIEKSVKDAADWLRERGISRVDAMYGVSMGGACVIRFLATEEIPVERAIIDAGITPYPYPRFICRLISYWDWLTVMLATKSMTLMKLAMPPERWTPKGEDPETHYRRIFAFEKQHFPPRPSITSSGPPTIIPCRIRSGALTPGSNTGMVRKRSGPEKTIWPIPERRIRRQLPGSSRAWPTQSCC